jgi:serine/threonine protein kinase
MHRDLKPENILLDIHLNVRVADFGLAMPQNLVSEVESISQLCIGTTRFMAPELFDKDQIKKIGVETDIWSLGCMLIEIFSNKRPWDYINSQNVNNVYYEICKRRPIPIPDLIPAEVRGLI